MTISQYLKIRIRLTHINTQQNPEGDSDQQPGLSTGRKNPPPPSMSKMGNIGEPDSPVQPPMKAKDQEAERMKEPEMKK